MFMILPARNTRIHSINFIDGHPSNPFETYKVNNASIWQKMYYRTLANNFYVTIRRKKNGKKHIVCVNRHSNAK